MFAGDRCRPKEAYLAKFHCTAERWIFLVKSPSSEIRKISPWISVELPQVLEPAWLHKPCMEIADGAWMFGGCGSDCGSTVLLEEILGGCSCFSPFGVSVAKWLIQPLSSLRAVPSRRTYSACCRKEKNSFPWLNFLVIFFSQRVEFSWNVRSRTFTQSCEGPSSAGCSNRRSLLSPLSLPRGGLYVCSSTVGKDPLFCTRQRGEAQV